MSDYEIAEISVPTDIFFVERIEWGPFIGTIRSVDLNGKILEGDSLTLSALRDAQRKAANRLASLHDIERNQIGAINHYMEKGRLKVRKEELTHGKESPEYRRALEEFKAESDKLDARYLELSKEATIIKERDAKYTMTLADIGGREKTIKLSEIVRYYPANSLTFPEKIRVYLSRWWEFLTQEPREANAEGGVMPAIFGTFCMTVLMALAVAPFGVMAALYLREYAKQGRLVSLVRICVNNLAGVPSIVYGVFGLGFFAYILGGSIDELFFPERLPTPTFGTRRPALGIIDTGSADGSGGDCGHGRGSCSGTTVNEGRVVGLRRIKMADDKIYCIAKGHAGDHDGSHPGDGPGSRRGSTSHADRRRENGPRITDRPVFPVYPPGPQFHAPRFSYF